MGQMGFFSYRTSMKIRNNTIQAASMCRLDTDTTGKEVDQPDDVLSSSRYMLGRGVKRKRSRSEGEEERVPGPQAPDRQLILDLCLSKLHSCYAQAEPSLRRSVLLTNTLRHIQDQMRQEGVDPPSAPATSPPRAPPTPRHSPQLPPADPPLEPQGPSSSSSVDSLFGSFEISNSTSYLTDLALDDIFEDIDTSMYDSTDFSTLAYPDEGLKPPACTPAGALQLCLADLSELDHIMEVLVRS
ncbi:SERTA domain-containing protein 2-like [Conger conger]|uniref:SERTA domain-containing protein 2-like n=1 Tax=Conger conger TaxID=82655 RepID=UPI002A5A8C1E|nr:SERTA domain-containing protein 2-like [Conger conger]